MSTVEIESDLRDRLGVARDQGSRPTCLAFAASDAHAFHIGTPWNPLSCEYLFYSVKKNDGTEPGKGTNLPAISVVLRDHGQPSENEWPYLSALPTDLTDWIPPASPKVLYQAEVSQISPPLFDEAWTSITCGRPVIVIISVSQAFISNSTEGVIDLFDTTAAMGRHAILAVASGRMDKSRLLLVRNSWGTAWGIDGHCWLSEQYLASRTLAMASLHHLGATHV